MSLEGRWRFGNIYTHREDGHMKTEAEAGMTQYKSRGRAADNHQQEGRKDKEAF